MKTTLDIDDQLLADAKALAARQRGSLSRLIEEGLRLHLRVRMQSAAVPHGKLRLPVFKKRSGLVAGVEYLFTPARLEAKRAVMHGLRVFDGDGRQASGSCRPPRQRRHRAALRLPTRPRAPGR